MIMIWEAKSKQIKWTVNVKRYQHVDELRSIFKILFKFFFMIWNSLSCISNDLHNMTITLYGDLRTMGSFYFRCYFTKSSKNAHKNITRSVDWQMK